MPSTRDIRKASTNAPFLVERAINFSTSNELLSFRRSRSDPRNLLPPAALLRPPIHNKLVRPLVVPRLIPARRLSPGRNRMPSARSLAFPATMRMVHRIHRNATVHRLPAHPAHASCLADGDVLVIQISHLPNGRHAILRNLPRLARR